MKCYCHIHREMDEAISAIWGGAVFGFVLSFLYPGSLTFTFEHFVWWWTIVVTLRLLAVEPVRFIVLRRYEKRHPSPPSSD